VEFTIRTKIELDFKRFYILGYIEGPTKEWYKISKYDFALKM